MKSMTNKYEKAAFYVKRKREFYKHVFAYLIINLALFAIAWYLKNIGVESMPDYWAKVFWQIAVVDSLVWGLGIIAHGIVVFVPNLVFGKDWEERKIKELMDKNH